MTKLSKNVRFATLLLHYMTSDNRVNQAKKVTWVGFAVNSFLSAGKIFAGIFGHSAAMLADGVHSLSDFLTDLIVIFFLGISSKDKDENHDYGHGKFETFATLIISIMLVGVGIGILYEGAVKVYNSIFNELDIAQPSYIALIAALISIISKEWLYWYTISVGKKIKSDAVIANAWHHRTDAFSSVGTLIGISGAMFLGSKWRILDPIASIIVSVFIVIAGIKLFIPAVKELLESSLSSEIEEEITKTILGTNGVLGMHNLKTRKNGSYYIIDVHIKVNPNITIVAGHDISTDVENNLRNKYGKTVQTSIHIEPYKG